MQIVDLVIRIKRLLKKSPWYIFQRFLFELKIFTDRFANFRKEASFSNQKLLQIAGQKSINAIWEMHQLSIFIAEFDHNPNKEVPLDISVRERIFTRAARVMKMQIDLLGTGEIFLGEKITWNKDYKTGITWDNKYYRDISYVNFKDKSDVKIPWEISRMQWMIPVAQCYTLTGDDKYAEFAKEVIISWIDKNPFAKSVNWTCTMEVALRIIIFTYFFYTFSKSTAWEDEMFRSKFIKCLYLHAYFTVRNLEKSDVNGNHYTADAAGLIFAGLFFETYKGGTSFLETGKRILEDEILLQVFPDGVDYEASVPYHRLVGELFYYPTVYMNRKGKSFSENYMNRLGEMAVFTKFYMRFNGTVPLWGDADDARVLPLGTQHINDHLYFPSLVGLELDKVELRNSCTSSREEVAWLYGKMGIDKLEKNATRTLEYQSRHFPYGGFYIMGNDQTHIFVDCGPLGLNGRGGHGHNDILSFELMLDGQQLVTDCGSYLYTAEYLERNLFRSTYYHNTPMIDDVEVNRFISPTYLWNLFNDAIPNVKLWESTKTYDLLVGSHTGYHKLKDIVTPTRTYYFQKDQDTFLVNDEFIGHGVHKAQIPLHLASEVQIHEHGENYVILTAAGRFFTIVWQGKSWTIKVKPSRVSKSYGIVEDSQHLCWSSNDILSSPLTYFFAKGTDPVKCYRMMEENLIIMKTKTEANIK